MKTYEIECYTADEWRWFEVKANSKNEAMQQLFDDCEEVEKITHIREVDEE